MAKGKRFEERVDATAVLEEAVEGKPRRIRFDKAMTADVVNGNRRRYPSAVLESAIAELRSHLNESAGQGRAIQVLGEAEHPSDKPTKRPNLLETIVKWEEVSFDGKDVTIIGRVLETSKGKDILTLMEGGVMPGVSMRGYGDGKTIGKGDDRIFEVSELHITGFDPVLEPSFDNAAQLIESHIMEDEETSPEDKGMSEELVKKIEEQANEKAMLEKKLEEAQKKAAEADVLKAQIEESKRQEQVDSAIVEATKDLPFGEKLNKLFVESIRGASLKSADEVKAFVEAKRKEYGTLAAAGVLEGLGFKDGRITSVAPVLERETGIPEFGRASFEILETVRKHENRAKRSLDLRADSPAAVFTENLLKRFDTLYQHKLIAEARLFTEAEAASDLNLPYSVSRAIIAEAYPNLVAANVFDIGIMEQTPMNIYYEAYAGETGYSVDITDEVVTGGAEGTWYDLAHKNVVPGTVVVTSNPAGTSYVEGTDYVVDYMLGKILFLTAGSIGANDILIDYTYHATRQGEGVAIERAKTTLSYQTITAAAMRLADDINTEAIVFSRSQLGWDAVGRTMANLIKEMRRDIDRALIEKAVMAALSVASNSTAAWDVSDAVYATFVSLLGQAKVKVLKRFYEPTAILMSVTNADYLSNWDGFKRDGFPNALLNAAGFAGSVKGLPVFNSTEMRDTWNLVLNRELVMHRVFQPMTVKGPFPKYSSDKLIAAEQYYAEEFNASLAPIGGKGSLVPTQA